ncbi:MAG: hypothetical protein NWF14_00530 [Candidatus Bathyarchaeota archaeon]|nr:hypothetical protein [Candidatus Bathyarchaeota archaeon]
MSNSFTSTPTLVDPGRVTAGQTIRTTEVSRLGDLQNYCFALGGTHNVISQVFDDSCFIQDSTSFVTMCEWTIPLISREHDTLIINVSGFCPTAANATAQFTLTMDDSTTYSTTISITDQSRYSSAFNQGTISVTGSHSGDTAVLTMELKAPSGQEATILGVQASWQALTSPLTTGELQINNRSFVPQGASRLGADLPLSARFGVETLANINTLRTRGRVLFNWSGVEGASSSLAITSAGAPPRGIGRGDLPTFYSPAAIFGGTVENSLSVRVCINVKNLGSGDSFSFIVMGNTLSLSANGWTKFEIDLLQDELPLSDQFGLSMYRAGVDERTANVSGLASPSYPPSTSGYVAGLAIIGV